MKYTASCENLSISDHNEFLQKEEREHFGKSSGSVSSAGL